MIRLHAFALAASLSVLGAGAFAAAPSPTTHLTVTPAATDTGSETPPHFAANPLIATQALLAGNGSEAGPQTANSLPPGFADGTAPQLQADSEARYFAAAADRNGRGMVAAR